MNRICKYYNNNSSSILQINMWNTTIVPMMCNKYLTFFLNNDYKIFYFGGLEA